MVSKINLNYENPLNIRDNLGEIYSYDTNPDLKRGMFILKNLIELISAKIGFVCIIRNPDMYVDVPSLFATSRNHVLPNLLKSISLTSNDESNFDTFMVENNKMSIMAGKSFMEIGFNINDLELYPIIINNQTIGVFGYKDRTYIEYESTRHMVSSIVDKYKQNLYNSFNIGSMGHENT